MQKRNSKSVRADAQQGESFDAKFDRVVAFYEDMIEVQALLGCGERCDKLIAELEIMKENKEMIESGVAPEQVHLKPMKMKMVSKLRQMMVQRGRVNG